MNAAHTHTYIHETKIIHTCTQNLFTQTVYDKQDKLTNGLELCHVPQAGSL